MKIIRISNSIAEWITYDGKYIKSPYGLFIAAVCKINWNTENLGIIPFG